jgi:hypothetical protein
MNLIAFLILQFIPVFVFHTNESVLPTSIEHYISKCEMWPPIANVTILSSEILHSLPNTQNHTLRLKKKYKQQPIKKTPIYVKVITTNHFIYITYVLFYSSQPSYFTFFAVGDHDADIEHLTVKINKQEHNIHSIYYASHTSSEGLWVKPNNFDTINSHPVAYVALNGHGMYNKRGYYFRYFGFGNDVTGSGHHWQPSSNKIIRLNHTDYDRKIHGFINFEGTYGNGRVDAIQTRDWWTNPASETSNNAPLIFNRFIDIRLDIVIVLSWLCGAYNIYKFATSYKVKRYYMNLQEIKIV